MLKKTTAQRAQILRCLTEGNSIASTARITGAAENTVLKFIKEAGEACAAYQSKHFRNLPCSTIQVDEIWSFVGCREKTKDKSILKHPGDVWTWTSICADTKLIPVWRVGDRSARTARAFCYDLAERFEGTIQITSDGHPAYKMAVGRAFAEVNYAKLVKIYEKDSKGRNMVQSVQKEAVLGNPDMNKVSTSYVERSNLTIRMGNRRFTRLTNGFSKNIENHCHQIAITMMHYNFCRRHQAIKQTPAMAAGITGHEWSMEEVVEVIDAYYAEKIEAEFEAAFANLTRPRTLPKTYAPVAPKLPWYLDTVSGGAPNRPVGKKPLA